MDQTLINNFEKVFILRESLDSEVAQRALQVFPFAEVLDQEPSRERKGALSPEEFSRSKKQLLIKPFAGHFFKRCPGATQKKALACCNYHVLNLGSQCHFNCSYCYLQSYLNNNFTVIYSNIDQAMQELSSMAAEKPDALVRVGTGEVIDSLGLDPLTLYSRKLIELFKKFPNWTLEFKTKSDFVDQFLDCSHVGNVVVSWSINPEYIVGKEEHGTASLEQRLQAARKCVDKGFKVAFHIDPVIYFNEWKTHYQLLFERIQSQFTAAEIQVISLGALRFQPEQRHMMRERFGWDSLVNRGEMFQSESGKMRYDLSLRQEMFDFIVKGFKSHSPAWNIFLCMETPETWLSVFEKTPMQIPELRSMFKPLPQLEAP